MDDPRWGGLTSALRWYLRARARLVGGRSLDDMLQEHLRYGCRIDGGHGSSRDVVAGDVALIDACLPPTEDQDGREVEAALVARRMLLLSCGGDREDGLTLHQAAGLCREEFGDGWTFARCQRLFFRAQAETRAALRERGLIPRAWEG